MGAQGKIEIGVRQFSLHESLQDYFTALYLFSVECPPGALVEDQLHPEWAVMRFTAQGEPPVATIGPGSLDPTWPFVVSGPTSKAIRFGLAASRIWGLGLHPAGFARYLDIPASSIADQIVNGGEHPAFAYFARIMDIVSRDEPPEKIARQIEKMLLCDSDRPITDEDRILSCQNALRDVNVATVADLSDRLGIARRSLERLCARYFGFPPKVLLRRQRFLRSLAQFMVAGEASWCRSLDDQYYDQAHFVRDFKSFMGTTPSEYAETPHPVIDRIMAQRMADQGALPQTNLPTVLRYSKERQA